MLILYAGHRIHERATQGAFWLPAGARADRPFARLPAAAIPDAILRTKAGSVLVIPDSCHSGALLRAGGTVAVAVPDAGGDGHPVFARALLTGLDSMEPDACTARDLSDRYLLPMVVGRAAQEPQYRPTGKAGHAGGDVVLLQIAR